MGLRRPSASHDVGGRPLVNEPVPPRRRSRRIRHRPPRPRAEADPRPPEPDFRPAPRAEPVFDELFRATPLPADGLREEVARVPPAREPPEREVPERVPPERASPERVVLRRSAPRVVDFLPEVFLRAELPPVPLVFEGADLPPPPVVFLVAAFFALRRVARATAFSRRSTRCEARRICPSSPGVSSRQSPTDRPFSFSGPSATRRSFFTG